MTRELFTDAGAWIALNDRGDKYYPVAVDFYQRLLRERRPLVTTNLVIAEAYIAIRRGRRAPTCYALSGFRPSERPLAENLL